MTATTLEPVRIALASGASVSGLLLAPARPSVLYVLAHGAGAGMQHPFMDAIAAALAARHVATLRFMFPYTEAQRRRPDRPDLLQETIAAAIGAGAELMPRLPLVAGGKSMGGRMTSLLVAREGAPPRLRGIVFLGFPLHAAGQPSEERAAHLAAVRPPMLFLQGGADRLAAIDRMRDVVASLGARATLHEIPGADHSFAVPKRSGRSAESVLGELADTTAAWCAAIVTAHPSSPELTP